MKNFKKAFKIIALVTALGLILFAFAGCKSKAKGKSIVDNRGVTYVVVTEENGENVTDEAGNLVVYDNLGETQLVATPDYYVSDGKVISKLFSLTPPKGWVASSAGGDDVDLTHEGTGNTVRLVSLKSDLAKGLEDMETLAEASRKEGVEVTVSTEEMYGVKATVNTIKSQESTIVFYIFEKNGSAFSFYSIAKKDFKDKAAGFNEVFDAVEFK